jgi:glycolate oxidase FAD binding subunit
VIGVEMALVDGRLAKAGGRVVKNVAGYDLSRLLCGSWGSLAVITKATFKLVPLSDASITIASTAADLPRLAAIAREIAAGPLAPSAIEIASPPHRLLVRFETTRRAAEAQAKQTTEVCLRHGARAMVLVDGDEEEIWREHDNAFWSKDGAVVKISVLPADASDALVGLGRLAGARHVEHRVCGRAALGVLYARLCGDDTAQAAIVSELREYAAMRQGHVAVVSSSPGLKSRVDPWGDTGDALPLMRAVKASFDPRGTLNPGRGPGGI